MKAQSAERIAVDQGGTVHLPEDVLRQMGWEQGDSLWAEVVDGGQLILTRHRRNVAEEFAGAFTDLYPDPEDTRRFLDEGRGYAEDDAGTEQRSA